MTSVYDASDLFLFPTLFDPFPLATLEALSAGIPVITTSANGVSEIMSAGVHGEVIHEPSDKGAFVDALIKWFALLEDPERAETIRGDCSILASGFTLERNLQETLSVIREVIVEKEKS